MTLSSATLLAVLLGSIRAAAWLMVCPPFNTRLIPMPVKALLSVAIALPMAPRLSQQVPDFTGAAVVTAAVEQVVAGMALGFITSLVFAAIQAAGDLIDLFGGFSLATAFDPVSQTPTSVFGRFYNLTATTLLLASGGYQLVIRGFTETFELLPLDGTLALGTLSELLTTGMTDMFLAALQIAGPIIAVLFCADVALGLLSRAAPALNAFSLGFPLKIMLTLSLAGTAVAVLPGVLDGVVDKAVRFVMEAAGS
ncbi:flagellar biosynthetic protein FliR [Spirillospora albida]|uniref:flagellar biosynthetic protein FliR n=1 Tax=Spirillospora albida TaxID=58123 RepID=UPI0004C2934B|nr:flagellar biosynthetic protein FliR [Spirillospora albida]